MNKMPILLLLLIIALAFYLSEENQPKKPSSLINLPNSQLTELLNQGWPAHFPHSEPSQFKGLNPPHSQVAEPWEPPKAPSEPKPTIKLSTEEPEFLSDDSSLNETYRCRFLTLLNDFTATPLTLQATKALQIKGKPLYEYYQALWNLKALPSFSTYLAQPLREWINLTTSIKPPEAPTDYGWLTDDNLEFILVNHQPIQSALAKTSLFHLRTDIANIYNSFQKAKTNQDWDLPEFLQELTLNKAPYTLFPLRVNGNHWGLFILHNLTWQDSEATYQVYYTSSGGVNLEQEKTQLQPFINQIVGESTPLQIILPTDRQSQGYNCGVYLVFYLQEILEKRQLTLTRYHSLEACQQFRYEWKERIGAKWCKLI